MDDANKPDPMEAMRVKYAFWLAVVGLGLSTIIVAFLVTFANMTDAAELVGVVGAFTSVTGTLVGGFFGMQIGVAGKEQERNERRRAERMVEMALASMEPAPARKLMEDMRDWSRQAEIAPESKS